MSHILLGDSLDRLKELDDNSIDSVITDPPYGYSFMGKDWDKAVPGVEIWHECLRVLKPGAFCMVMSAPRSDVQNAMISRLMEAGFRLDFTPIYWTYASGFPKAGNIGKLVDKRLGAKRESIGEYKRPDGGKRDFKHSSAGIWSSEGEQDRTITAPATDQARALDGSYAGFQPKPAVEVIIVAMKPLSEKTYVDQALKNGHGVTWLDGGRIPTGDTDDIHAKNPHTQNYGTNKVYGKYNGSEVYDVSQGRFPANLLVSDTILADHSRYFDLDAWADTLPFLAVPKASKGEKNRGLEDREHVTVGDGRKKAIDNAFQRGKTERLNSHPTVKPLKLMSYLITLTSRPGDTVLDPFVGSGTTAIAAEQLGRIGIGIEREEEYAEIARARLAHVKPQLPVEKPEPTATTIEDVTQASLFEDTI